MDLELTAFVNGPVTVVTVVGEVDASTSPRLQECLDVHLGSGRTRLVLDVSGMSFLDSTGLRVLVGRLRLAKLHGGSIRLACPTPRIRRILTITGVDSIFALDTVLADSIAACAPRVKGAGSITS